ncbi:MAG: hypothetical protein K2K37_06855, partial [Muribaculaceae bacterium]|nr:hypothetical protein [Muribaculaceae bacterium]
MKNLLLPTLILCSATFANGAERKAPFNDGWVFSINADSTAIIDNYDDSRWQRITLPHDWSIMLPFDKDCPAGNDGG